MDRPADELAEEVRLRGVAASPGVAAGPLLCFAPDVIQVRKRHIREDEVNAEITRFEQALLDTRHQLQEIRTRLSQTIGEKDAAVFDAHLLMVDDPAMLDGVRQQVQTRLLCVEYIYQHIANAFARTLQEAKDPYLSERAHDILDVSRRVLRNLEGLSLNKYQALDSPTVIFAHDLTPSDTATLDRANTLGFITELGSKTSHTAIMAHSLNIPAVVGVHDIDFAQHDGKEVLIDGYEGIVIISPTEQTKFEYGQIENQRHEVESRLSELRETLASTIDGRRITVSANVELPEDLPLVNENGAEGVGLFRSEFIFLNRDELPSEDEQLDLYQQVAEASQPHSAIIRTLDIGGDKLMPQLAIEPELNPFLGWRGIRYCLGREDVFRTQLRAVCRASEMGNVRVMFPMISTMDELRRARKILDDVKWSLGEEGYAVANKIEIGMMVEVPSAALLADAFASEVDFFSIGTNDLIQYTLAVDRGNDRVADLYQPAHPAVLRLIQGVADAAHRHNIWVGVCGEMASDLRMLPALVGLGVDELSLGSVFISRVKSALSKLSFTDCSNLRDTLLNASTAGENQRVLDEMAERLYPDVL